MHGVNQLLLSFKKRNGKIIPHLANFKFICYACSLNQPDDEPDPEERDHFLQQLYKFMEDRGNACTSPAEL